MADIKESILLNIKLNAPEVEKELNIIRAATLKAKEEQKALKKEYEEYTKIGDSASAAKVGTQLSKTEATIKGLNEQQRRYSTELRLTQQISEAQTKGEASSLENVRKARDLSQLQLTRLKGTLKENADGTLVLTDKYKEASKTTLDYSDAVIKFGAGIKDGRANVGNYTQSISDAISQTGLFGNTLSQVQQAFSGVQSAAQIFANGTTLLTKGLSDIKGTLGETTEKIKGFFTLKPDPKQVGSVQEVAAELPKVAKGAEVGARGMKVLKVAIASTGIGLLLIAISGLVAAFTKTEAGAELLERKFAAIGGVVDFLIGGFAKVGTAIIDAFTAPGEVVEKLFKGLKDPAGALTGFASGLKNAASAAEELKRKEQDLEEAQIASIVTQEKLRLQAEKLRIIESDKTRSAQERITASQQASDIEAIGLLKNLEFATAALNIERERLRISIANGTARDADFKKVAEQTAEVLKLTDDVSNKKLKNTAETSKLINQLNKEEITNTLSLLDNQLKAATLNGQSTVALQREIAKQKKDAALKDATESGTSILKINSDYNLALLEIDKKFAEERNKIRQQTEDAAINLIIDAQTREVAAEALNTKRKIDAIKGSTQEEILLREQYIQESSIKILAINDKYEQKSKEQSLKGLDARIKQEQNENKRAQIAKENDLKIALSNQKITQTEFDTQLAGIKLAGLKRELELQVQYQAQRQLIDQQAYLNDVSQLQQRLNEKKISQQQYNGLIVELNKRHGEIELQTTTETGTLIQSKTDEINQAKVDSTINANNQITESFQRSIQEQLQVQQLSLEFAGVLISGFNDLLNQDKENRKKYSIAIKALGIAEVIINLQKEISNIAVGISKDTAKFGILGTAASTTAGAIQVAISTARAGFSINKILTTKFAKGGYSSTGGEEISMSDVIKYYQPQRNDSKITHGGYVSSPTLSYKPILTGEKGTEHISPSWMVNNTKLKPVYSMLESIRRSRVIPFESGGFSQPMPFYDGGFAASRILGNQLNVVDIKEAVTDGVSKLPNPVVIVQDINDVQGRVALVRGRADN